MYVAIKGGERAIRAAHALLDACRRGDPDVPELDLDQIREQLGLAVDRVMAEGSLYDPEFAALAVKQVQGDLVEAIFLLRAYRTTLPRLGESEPVDTTRMAAMRRVSAVYKDLPGGQILGPTFDYTHRLLDFELADGRDAPDIAEADEPLHEPLPRVLDWLNAEGLIEPPGGMGQKQPDTAPDLAVDDAAGAADAGDDASEECGGPHPHNDDPEPGDITLDPLELPAGRDVRLQCLARADEGFLLSMAYSTQRGFGRNHPFAGEIRTGEVAVELCPEELGFPVSVADITVTEADMINQFKGGGDVPAQFTRGYGLVFGRLERKAVSMALVDRALRAEELGEEASSPAQDHEFVLLHADNVQASGFVQHVKLPHYADFQSELALVRGLRRKWEAGKRGEGTTTDGAGDTPEAHDVDDAGDSHLHSFGPDGMENGA